jgi:hypothetical protein
LGKALEWGTNFKKDKNFYENIANFHTQVFKTNPFLKNLKFLYFYTILWFHFGEILFKGKGGGIEPIGIKF